MGTVFGFIGVLLSIPMAAYSKSTYEEFYLNGLKPDVNMDQRIEFMLNKSNPATA